MEWYDPQKVGLSTSINLNFKNYCKTCPEICFHGDSQSHHADSQDYPLQMQPSIQSSQARISCVEPLPAET